MNVMKSTLGVVLAMSFSMVAQAATVVVTRPNTPVRSAPSAKALTQLPPGVTVVAVCNRNGQGNASPC